MFRINDVVEKAGTSGCPRKRSAIDIRPVLVVSTWGLSRHRLERSAAFKGRIEAAEGECCDVTELFAQKSVLLGLLSE